MKNLYYNVIIVFLGIIIAAFNIDIKTDSSTNSSYGYSSYNNAGSFNVANPIVPNNPLGSINTNPTQGNVNVPTVLKENEFMSAGFDYSLGDARLIGEPGSMQADIALSINPIDGDQLPPLNQGMVNVTADNSGYQMLPKGMVFKNDIDIILPYDTTLLPVGFTPNDIKTYYYDETYKRWIEIPRDSVDEANQLVISKVNHFTDFINAIIKTPEMPETASFAPTQMNDIKAANPLEGFSLMQPPSPNNMGTANISYPLWIPAGRQGMQPNLTLSYNSSGENGWLGQGWDINIPMISVETRWGVPWYDQQYESEIYLLDGEQLATKSIQEEELKYDKMPNRRKTWVMRNSSGAKRFYKRVEGGFEKIERFGSNPKNYYWKVTDKNGIMYYYGKMKNNNALDHNTILKDKDGNIAKWGLTRVEDLYGNNIFYFYNCINSINQGSKLQISEIHYTGKGSESGIYRIKFLTKSRSTLGLQDDYTSCNYGCIEKNDQVLTHIMVYTDDHGEYRHLIKGYVFGYGVGGFGKTILKTFGEFSDEFLQNNNWETMMDNNTLPRCTTNTNFIILNTFDYYEKPSSMFSQSPIEISPEQVLIPEYRSGCESSPLGSTYSSSDGWGGAITVGWGENPAVNSFSAGGNYNNNTTNAKTKSSLIDIDGDGLPDRVYLTEDDDVYYEKNDMILSGTFKTPVKIYDGLILNKEKIKNSTLGLEGHLSVFGAGLTAAYGFTTTKSSVDQYFTDVDADGLPDLIISGQVYFNRLNDGVPNFEKITTETVIVGGSCENGIIFNDVPVDENMFLPGNMVITEVFNKELGIFELDTIFTDPLVEQELQFDAVRVWVAPYSGYVQIESYAQLTSELMFARNESRVFDGVKISIQNNGNIINSAILTPLSDTSNLYFDEFEITKGDRLYFRVEARERRAYDKVYWNPRIKYLYTDFGDSDTNMIDPNGERTFVFDANEDFLVYSNKKYHIGLENNSKINIKTNLNINEALTSSIEARIYYNNDVIDVRTFNEGYIGNEDFNFDDLDVLQGDSIWFEIYCPTNIKWKSINWNTSFYYTETSIPSFTPIVNENGVMDTLVYYRNLIPNYISYPQPIIPTGLFIPTINTTTTGFSINIQGISNNGNYIFSVKDDYGTIYEKFVTLSNGLNSFSVPPKVLFSGSKYYFNLYSQDYLNCINASNAICYFNSYSTLIGLYTSTKEENLQFGSLYRNWGQFCYQKEENSSDEINQDLLYFNMDKLVIANENNYPNFHDEFGDVEEVVLDYDPSLQNFLKMDPDYLNQRWYGYGEITYIKNDTISNTLASVNETDETLFPFKMTINSEIVNAPLKNSFGESNSLNLKLGLSLEEFSEPLSKVCGGKISNLLQDLDFLNLGGGYTFNWGWNTSVSDFMDVNGDKYPDIISKDEVQYSKPQGGLSTFERGFTDNTIEGDRSTKTRSKGGAESYGATLDYPYQFKNSDGKVHSVLKGGIALSYGESENTDRVIYNWMDINGDGIKDRIYENGVVRLGLGYSYLNYGNWQYSNIETSNTKTFGGSFGSSLGYSIPSSLQKEYNKFECSIGGGIGYNNSNSFSDSTIIDVNGDGLVDLLYFYNEPNLPIYVKYNLGNSFSTGETLQSSVIDNINYTNSFSKGFNVDLCAGFTIGSIPIKFVINGDYSFNEMFSRLEKTFIDMNADQLLDYVSFVDGQILVYLNQSGKTNLLKSVNNFVNGSFTIGYQLSENSYNNPSRNYIMSEVIIFDGHYGDAETFSLNNQPIECQILRYEYENPYYDRYERMSYGYEVVRTIYPKQNFNAIVNNKYRTTTNKYYNNNYKFKGLMYYELISGSENEKYIEKFHNYILKEIETGDPITENFEYCFGEGYPAINEEIVNYYEGETIPQLSTRKTYTHGAFGNVISFFDYGNTSNNCHKDDYFATITYHPDQNNKNILSIPSSITVTDNFYNRLMRRRETTIDFNTGDVTGIKVYLNNNTYAETNYFYDQYGNITHVDSPIDANQQRQHYSFAYDLSIHTYPIQITDESLNLSSSSSYDINFGKPIQIIDINGQTMIYENDRFGRTTKIISPNEVNPSNQNAYTIKFDYWLTNSSSLMNNIPYAVTKHFNNQNPSNPIETVLFTDGFGKVIQTKKDIDINGVEKRVVSGFVKYDLYGRVIETYDPIIEDIQTPQCTLNSNIDNNTPTKNNYDVLDRQVKTTLPNSVFSTYLYSIEDDCFVTTLTDPKLVVNKVFNDSRGLKVKTHNIPEDIQTILKYNALGELTETIDPDNHSTYYFYDMFGRRTKRQHPDSGIDSIKYDLVGHVINKYTQKNLYDQTSIDYVYNYSQLQEIRYPDYPENNVKYFYGDQNALYNRKGRLYAIEDASGRQENKFGKMGEVIENIHTFVLPNETNLYTFKTSFMYDSWNRLLQMTYPDGEVLNYNYNYAGNLKSMSSQYNNTTTNYITNIKYNKFEQKTDIYYGNGTESHYTYDNIQRLSNLKTQKNTEILQDIDYTYDNANNISTITNNSRKISNGLGGEYFQQFQYDDLYRLRNSSGTFIKDLQTDFNYSLQMSYTPDGRIISKQMDATQLLPGMYGVINYNNAYSYNTQNHKLIQVSDTARSYYSNFSWDNNGNMTYQGERKLCWDDENRLLGVTDASYTSYYSYDHSGNRFYKLTGASTYMNVNGVQYRTATLTNPTLYIEGFVVATRQGYTKHYYNGSERVASSIGLGGITTINTPLILSTNWTTKKTASNTMMNRLLNTCLSVTLGSKVVPFTMNLYRYATIQTGSVDKYYYHTNHLGSSSWITDGSGNAIQHLQNLPYGEDWVDERNTTWNSRYTFTGKEKDAETGYGYFGARYYDSGLSIWLSVDPMSDKYPSMSPYNYCANNPVILVDPDGRYPWPISYKYDNGTRDVISGMYRNTGGAYHGAVDIVHKTSSGNISGGTVYATHGGTVTQSGNSETAGNWIQITNGDIRTTYMHLENEPTQKVGDNVTELTKIGTVGTTGKSEGPHLHYQIEMYNSETEEWEKVNPVVGQPDKVSSGDDVNLYDPQKYIDWREGKTPGSSSANPATLNEQEVKSTCEEQNN